MALLAYVLMATSPIPGYGVPAYDVAGPGAVAAGLPLGSKAVPYIAPLPVATGSGASGEPFNAALLTAPSQSAAPDTPSGPASPPAAAPAAADSAPADAQPPHDPWEPSNRAIFAFDMAIDRHFLGPVSRGYSAVLPGVVRHHIGLVIANLDEPVTIVNHLLQLHFGRFSKSLVRFTLNSTIGLGGIFDFASHHKLPHQGADFGQTLGRWGVKPGNYAVLPLLGPSNQRDALGRAVDLAGDPVSWLLGGITTTFGGSRAGTEIVDSRAEAEPALRAVNDSTDPYAATRSGYMQARAAKVREATGEAEVLPDFGTP